MLFVTLLFVAICCYLLLFVAICCCLLLLLLLLLLLSSFFVVVVVFPDFVFSLCTTPYFHNNSQHCTYIFGHDGARKLAQDVSVDILGISFCGLIFFPIHSFTHSLTHSYPLLLSSSRYSLGSIHTRAFRRRPTHCRCKA